MYSHSRRQFIANGGKTTVAAGLGIFTANNIESNMSSMKGFIHHVYFWLNNPQNEQDTDKLIKGLQKLSKAKSIKDFHIGVPANTNRDVIDRSYAVSWMLVFKNQEDQDKYQVDPVHLKFIEECKHLWSKVVVYDSVNAR